MKKDLQCGMVGVSWSILDGPSWSVRKWLPSDQLNPVSSTENAIFGPTSPGRHKISCEGFIVEKRIYARSFNYVSFMSISVLIAKV